MKGTFFSSDFVLDKNDNLRLIEVNTDTGIIPQQKSVLDWTEFISVLEKNNITEVEVIYKHAPQGPIVESLSEAIKLNAPFITNFIETLVEERVIFPPAPEDLPHKFDLRMAYDELAILDSEYAKGTLGLLKLFADEGDDNSIIGFRHSSEIFGEYNTIDPELSNPANIPDIITKTSVELQQPHNFYKIGKSSSPSESRLNEFYVELMDPDIVFEEYHYKENDTKQVFSQRTFQIVYGNELKLCYVADYEIGSILELPPSIEYDDTKIINKISRKHYYEFATNHIKNYRHGFLGDTEIQNLEGGTTKIQDVEFDKEYKSYFIEGAPDTEDELEIRKWVLSGNTFPEGSHFTNSTAVSLFPATTYANDMTSIVLENDSVMVIGGETRLLVYDTVNSNISYKRAMEVTPQFALLTMKVPQMDYLDETSGYQKIKSVNTTIFEEEQTVYSLDLTPVDNFLIEADGIFGVTMAIFYTVHNCCFPAGTKITMGNNEQWNIEDIIPGNEVMTFNEKTGRLEPNRVFGIKTPINDDQIKYIFDNGDDLTCTFDHPIYVNDLELASYKPVWTKGRYNIESDIKKIKLGDRVYFKGGEKLTIERIEIQPLRPTQTYVLKVEHNHNFFANNILVHNK